MLEKATIIDKGQIYSKIVYIYFCFFSMFVAQRFAMNLAYGAALFFSLSALFRMFSFTAKTMYDSALSKMLKSVIVIFFTLSTAYIILLYPFLFVYPKSVFAIIIIILPFLEREAENYLLRKRSKDAPIPRKQMIKTLVLVQLLFIALASILALIAGVGVLLVVLIGSIIGMLLNFFRQYTYHDYTTEYPKPSKELQNIDKVHSVRVFGGMVISSGVALNIFAFTYILFIMSSRVSEYFLDFFVVFAGLALVFAGVVIGISRFMRSSLIQRIGKNAVYLLGTAICIFAVYAFRESWLGGTVEISMQTLLLLIGLTLQMSGAHGLKDDILHVIKLYDNNIDEHAFSARTTRLSVWTSVISEAVALIVLIVLISTPIFYKMNVEEYIQYAPYIGGSVVVLPTVVLIVSLVLSIKQPLTKKYGHRLKAYFKLIRQGKSNPHMEKRLKHVLVKKYKKRIGVHIIRAFLKPIMYHTVTGKENVTHLPGIFVFNHGEIYGPIAAVVFLPYDIRPWILSKMIDKQEITDHIYSGTFAKVKWLPEGMSRRVAKMLSPIIVWALGSFDPIPVFRGSSRDIIKTFAKSAECLAAGDSILLFPENPEEEYEEKVSAFYKGFASLGKHYYKKSGEKVTFYPVYASKRKRDLRIGEGVTYNPDSGSKERDRIVTALEERMRDLQSLDE